jgi:hypothetical protein
MKKVITQNKFYEIAVDTQLNRAYLKIIGFWRSKPEVPHYIPDLEKALAHLQPSFTLLTDLSEMKTHPADVQELHLEAQALLLRKGLTQTAEVFTSSFVQFQAGNLSRKSKMPLRQFVQLDEAEIYLNTL